MQLFNLGLSEDINIFEGLTLPEDSPLSRDIIINSILEKCGLNIPMYADVKVMRSAINLWSAKNQYTFIHVGKIYAADYSPIENTDRYDSITVDRGRDMKDNTTIKNQKTENGTTTNQNTNTHGGTDNSTIEETTSADNVSDYQPKDKTNNTTRYNSTITDNGTNTINKTTGNNGTNNKAVDEKEKTTTIQHLHGNIGTTTNTTLQSEEYALIKDYNPYDFIAGLFENSLTLCIY
jgi:hypothetical protein